MLVVPSDNLSRHRRVEFREPDHVITTTHLKDERYKAHPDDIAYINAGFLILPQRLMTHADPQHSHDWSGIIDPLVDAGLMRAYLSNDTRYFNVGTPEELMEANVFISTSQYNSIYA